MNDVSDLYTQARTWVGKQATRPTTARDPVNVPMVRRWCEAMGETNPIFVDADAARAEGFAAPVSPPAMMEVWTMAQYRPGGRLKDDSIPVLELFDNAGYTGDTRNDVYEPHADQEAQQGKEYDYAFGSAHTTGFNLAYCDGSVHFVAYEIDPLPWWLSGGRSDDE